MAALIIVGALAIADKVEQRKEKKRNKRAMDEKRYRELQLETNQRITRQNSAGAAIENEKLIDVGPAESSEEENENVRVAGSHNPPPAYEDAVQAGERREAEWRAKQMERRRSSVASQRSGGSGDRAASGAKYSMRMG